MERDNISDLERLSKVYMELTTTLPHQPARLSTYETSAKAIMLAMERTAQLINPQDTVVGE